MLDFFVGQADELFYIDWLHVFNTLLTPIELVLVVVTQSLRQKRLLPALYHLFDMELLPEFFCPLVKGLILQKLFLLLLREWNRYWLGLLFLTLLFLVALVLSTTAFLAGGTSTLHRGRGRGAALRPLNLDHPRLILDDRSALRHLWWTQALRLVA